MMMSTGQGKSLAEQIAELEDPTPKDFDPEDHSDGALESSSRGLSGDETAGREHYEAVIESKLRQPAQIELGREYAGSRVSRHDLNSYNSDKTSFFEGDISEEGDDSCSSKPSDDNDEEDEEDTEADEEDEEGTEADEEISMSDISDGDKPGEDRRKKTKTVPSSTIDNDREELRQLMATGDRMVTATLSQAAKADATKGMAVKQQRLAFDALLNTWIKMQKGITALNSKLAEPEPTLNQNPELIESAESAAILLWNTLGDLRQALSDHYSANSANPKKRKRSKPATAATSSTDIWSQMCELEAQSLSHRRTVLDKWSRKVRGSRGTSLSTNNRGRLLNAASDEQRMSTILDSYVAKESRDNIQAASAEGPTGSRTHDNTAFYQSLLRDLVEQRMAATSNGNAVLSLTPTQLPRHGALNSPSGMRKDKVKRAVDTKASKGRKMKYTVHEKLQNFMTPEDRGSWSNRARDEFYASLLGRSVAKVLGEDESDEDVRPADSDDEGGLKLFRS